METVGVQRPNQKGKKQITVEAAGVEPVCGGKPNRLAPRDFGRIGL